MQLDLLAWQRPADVIPFPTEARCGHIRRLAERIHHARTAREAEHIWTRAKDTAARQMERAGIGVLRIEYEMDVMSACVMQELRRMEQHPKQPDGGAA